MLPVGDLIPSVDAPSAPERRVLAGRHIQLVPLDPACADELFEPSHGEPDTEVVWTYMPYGPFGTVEAMRDWMSQVASQVDPLFFCVRSLDDQALGMVSYLNIEMDHRCLEIGHIWYVPQAQRTRANTEAAYLLLEHAFDVLRCRRVEWKCDSLNARSRAAALRLGFTFEGIFRQHRVVRQRNRDTAWFSLLDSEWPQRRANLRRWLYDNEDGSLSLTQMNR